MGTRAIVKVIDKDDYENVVLSFYKQNDGYNVNGLGDALITFSKNKKVVNGFNDGAYSGSVFNGAGDYAVRLLCYLKEKQAERAKKMIGMLDKEFSKYSYDYVGNLYTVNINSLNSDEIFYKYGVDYIYEVKIGVKTGIQITCEPLEEDPVIIYDSEKA